MLRRNINDYKEKFFAFLEEYKKAVYMLMFATLILVIIIKTMKIITGHKRNTDENLAKKTKALKIDKLTNNKLKVIKSLDSYSTKIHLDRSDSVSIKELQIQLVEINKMLNYEKN